MTDHTCPLCAGLSPPRHEDSEYAAVGCALIDPTGEALRKMSVIIQPSDLYGVNDQIVFAACETIAKTHGVVDVVLVHDHLAETGRLVEIDGAIGLLRYMEAVSHTAHAEFYARVVLKNSLRRQVIAHGKELIGAAYGASESLDALRHRITVLADILESRMVALPSHECGREGLQ